MLYEGIDQGKHESPQWTDFIYQVMLTYNHTMMHSSITMTPYEATKPSNATDVKTYIELQATLTRKYPELDIGSSVKIYKKSLGHKERVSRFSQHVLTINKLKENHGQTYYKVEGNDRPDLRAELLKV